ARRAPKTWSRTWRPSRLRNRRHVHDSCAFGAWRRSSEGKGSSLCRQPLILTVRHRRPPRRTCLSWPLARIRSPRTPGASVRRLGSLFAALIIGFGYPERAVPHSRGGADVGG